MSHTPRPRRAPADGALSNAPTVTQRYDILVQPHDTIVSGVRSEDDAPLIAAAPELLETVETAWAYLQGADVSGEHMFDILARVVARVEERDP